MVAAEGPQVFTEGIPESSIDPTLEFIIQNYYTPAGEVGLVHQLLTVFVTSFDVNPKIVFCL